MKSNSKTVIKKKHLFLSFLPDMKHIISRSGVNAVVITYCKRWSFCFVYVIKMIACEEPPPKVNEHLILFGLASLFVVASCSILLLKNRKQK